MSDSFKGRYSQSQILLHSLWRLKHNEIVRLLVQKLQRISTGRISALNLVAGKVLLNAGPLSEVSLDLSPAPAWHPGLELPATQRTYQIHTPQPRCDTTANDCSLPWGTESPFVRNHSTLFLTSLYHESPSPIRPNYNLLWGGTRPYIPPNAWHLDATQ